MSMPQTETGGHWDGLTGLMVEHGKRVRERDEERARADRLADRAVMLESLVARQEAQLAEIARLLRDELSCGFWSKRITRALAVAEGES